ncbi:YbjN domain-containing protein [Paracoccaceae bacterium]|nr:YbjN domain-containing protein [Paracoccaceae bacterium]
MARASSIIFLDESHPIDALELIANEEGWEFVRDKEDEITITMHGGWKQYSLIANFNAERNFLKTTCIFEMVPPHKKLSKLYETINLVNANEVDGSFTFIKDAGLMCYTVNMLISEEFFISNKELKDWLNGSFRTVEKFYPTFQKSCWGEVMPKDAISVAFGKIAGHA